MKINKNVYTQELDKAYTILKQQYTIIKCLLELVDSNNNYDDDLTSIKQTIQRVEQLIQSIEGDLNAVEYDIDLINNYINTINEYIAQNGNTTEIGGNLKVKGNGQVNGNFNINGNLTIDGEPLSVGSINVVREDSLGGFLNTVFRYQSKEDIPNELQTQANIQSLKQVGRDTTAIIARYGSFDYVIQIDGLAGDNSVRGYINGYIYNSNIKDIIFITINTANGVATFTFNTDSNSATGNNEVIKINSLASDLLGLLATRQSFARTATAQEQVILNNIYQRLINHENIIGFITEYTDDSIGHAIAFFKLDALIFNAMQFSIVQSTDEGALIITLTYYTDDYNLSYVYNEFNKGCSSGSEITKGEKTYSIGTYDSESGGYTCTLISGEDIDLSTYDIVTLELWWENSVFPNKTIAFVISDLFGYVTLRFQELAGIVGFVDVVNLLSFSASIDSEPIEPLGLDTSKNMKITGYKF